MRLSNIFMGLFIPLVVLGGSPAQRDIAQEVVASCAVSMERSSAVVIDIVDDIGGVGFRVAAISEPNRISVKGTYDNLRPENRVWYDGDSNLQTFSDIICHEWAHQVWDALPQEARDRWERRNFQVEGWPAP